MRDVKCCEARTFIIIQAEKTAFHLAARGGHLLCLRLLFAAVESRRLLESLPIVDKVSCLAISTMFT